MALDPIGIIGAILIIVAWILETRKVIKTKSAEDLDLRFLAIYLVGGIILTYYSVRTNDLVFIILSGVISFLTLIEIAFIFIKKR
jgi:lipid-A-disaccharide synthase-like uncharacterized protein